MFFGTSSKPNSTTTTRMTKREHFINLLEKNTMLLLEKHSICYKSYEDEYTIRSRVHLTIDGLCRKVIMFTEEEDKDLYTALVRLLTVYGSFWICNDDDDDCALLSREKRWKLFAEPLLVSVAGLSDGFLEITFDALGGNRYVSGPFVVPVNALFSALINRYPKNVTFALHNFDADAELRKDNAFNVLTFGVRAGPDLFDLLLDHMPEIPKSVVQTQYNLMSSRERTEMVMLRHLKNVLNNWFPYELRVRGIR